MMTSDDQRPPALADPGDPLARSDHQDRLELDLGRVESCLAERRFDEATRILRETEGELVVLITGALLEPSARGDGAADRPVVRGGIEGRLPDGYASAGIEREHLRRLAKRYTSVLERCQGLRAEILKELTNVRSRRSFQSQLAREGAWLSRIA